MSDGLLQSCFALKLNQAENSNRGCDKKDCFSCQIPTVYDFRQEYEVAALKVYTLCHTNTELALETVGALVGRGAGVGSDKLLHGDEFAL